MPNKALDIIKGSYILISLLYWKKKTEFYPDFQVLVLKILENQVGFYYKICQHIRMWKKGPKMAKII